METAKRIAVVAAIASFAFYFFSGISHNTRSHPAERQAPYLSHFR